MNTVFGERFFSNESEYLFNDVLTEKKVIRKIKHLHERHYPTYAHSIGVAKLMAEYAVSNLHDFDEFEQKSLVRVALLHDLGKICVSKTILDSKRTLTKNEWIKIRQHSTEGFHRYAQAFDPTEGLPILLHHTFQSNCYPVYDMQKDIIDRYNIQTEKLTDDRIIKNSILLAVADSMEARYPDEPGHHINGVRAYSNRDYPVMDLPQMINESLTESGRLKNLDQIPYLNDVLDLSTIFLSKSIKRKALINYSSECINVK